MLIQDKRGSWYQVISEGYQVKDLLTQEKSFIDRSQVVKKEGFLEIPTKVRR